MTRATSIIKYEKKKVTKDAVTIPVYWIKGEKGRRIIDTEIMREEFENAISSLEDEQ